MDQWLGPRTPEREVGGSILTQVVVLCPWARHSLLPKSTGNTQEAVAPSRRDWKLFTVMLSQQRNETLFMTLNVLKEGKTPTQQQQYKH